MNNGRRTMTYLGSANLFYRLGHTIQGWFAPCSRSRPVPPDFYIIAHRGAARVAPENTLAAFAKALELGANAIETDICVTQDNHFILWHDADPDGLVAMGRQVGVEQLLYKPDVPALGSSWRRPVSQLWLSALRKYYRYKRRVPGRVEEKNTTHRLAIQPALFEDLLAWLRQEHGVRHVFLDLKFAPEQTEAAIALLDRLHGLYTGGSLRPDLVFHLLSPQLEIVQALVAEAQRVPLPSTLRLYADFELPGVCRSTRQLGIRHVSMGCSRRTWGDFRYEIAQVVAARDQGHFDAVIAWTVNNEVQLKDLVNLGINGIITDDPALLQRIMVQQACRSR